MSHDVVGREPVSRSHRLLVRLYFYRWPIAIAAVGLVVAALILIGGIGVIVTLIAAALMLTIWIAFITSWGRGISRAGKAFQEGLEGT